MLARVLPSSSVISSPRPRRTDPTLFASTDRRRKRNPRKRTSIFLNKLFGQYSVPLYTMISRTTMPYAEAVERHRRQERIAHWLGLDLVVGAVSLHVRLRSALARRRACHLASADSPLPGLPATVASNDVWAVGNAGSLKTLAIHWDGASWSVVPTPALNPNDTNPVLVGIVALSSNNIWTAGQFIVPVEGSAQHTLTENWNGSRWTVVPSPNAKNSNNRLHGITATPSDTLWAVGTTGVFGQPERTLILRKNP